MSSPVHACTLHDVGEDCCQVGGKGMANLGNALVPRPVRRIRPGPHRFGNVLLETADFHVQQNLLLAPAGSHHPDV